ncbi:MAG: site-2 protease family protein [Verrucomicrobiota bacterium]
MRWSFPVARVFGIQLRVHVTFLLLLLLVAGSQGSEGGWSAAVEAVSLILMVFGCVILHELGHAAAARYFGIQTPDITLLPIGGVAHLERIPERPKEEIIVALAGPLVSALLALFFWSINSTNTPALSFSSDEAVPLARTLQSINLGLLLFNLIPAFPMDGGRVLRACLAIKLGNSRATQTAARIGQGIAIIMATVGVLLPAHPLILISIFIFFAAGNEAASTALNSLSRHLRVADAMITSFQTLPEYATLGNAASLLQHSAQHDIPFINHLGKFIGLLPRKNLILGLHEVGPESPALPYTQDNLPTVLPTHLFSDAFSIMQEYGSPVLPVLDSRGNLVGLFSQEKVGELLLIQSIPRTRSKG